MQSLEPSEALDVCPASAAAPRTAGQRAHRHVPREVWSVRPRPPAQRGLSRPCLPSAAAWAAHLRDFEREAVRELGRKNGATKVLREILAELRDGVKVGDERTVRQIGLA